VASKFASGGGTLVEFDEVNLPVGVDRGDAND
jgi:hypothetical protein